ncbi:Cna B-type domain-containing protein [Lactococcus petauri]|uniref:Cna B-type domain-containing protein n=1 Tax=Lactococcus petauri TaxID=1940789 RepID=UPI0038782AE6
MFILTTFLSWYPDTAYATAVGKDVSNNVTSIVASPTEARDGDKVSISFEFDERSQDIQPGDFFNITWPSTGDISALGFTKTIDLQISGRNVGIMDISRDGAHAVFNDNIKNLDDVRGWGKFDIQVRNLTAGEAENTGILNIRVGERTASINVTKPATTSGGSSVFYYKTGDMLPEDTSHVRWFLCVNNNLSEVDENVIVKDQIQSGQRLDSTAFTIAVNDRNGTKTYVGESGVLKFLTDYPGTSFDYSIQNNTIDIMIPASVARYRQFTIEYKTIVENEHQESFTNKSQAWYKEYNQPVVSGKSFDYLVQNINASAGISGTVRGELKVHKKINGTEIGIPNVNFTLKRSDGNFINGEPSVNLTSDTKGEAGIKGLPVGDYLLQEISAPNWINFDPLTSPVQKFTVSDDDKQGVDLTIYNVKKTTDITARKVWKGGPERKPTIYLKLYRNIKNEPKEAVPNVSLKILEDGFSEVTWKNLPVADDYGNLYNYTIQEVDAAGNDSVPTGYVKNENGLLVTNTNVEKTSVSGTKTWDDNNNQDGIRPNSITVNLLADGQLIESKAVTQANEWKYQFTNLPKYKDGAVINYTVTEASVPNYTNTITGFNIKNSYTPEKTQVTVTKAWNDGNNQDGIRPSSIFVQLMKDGKAVEGQTLELSEANKWTGSFTDLDKKENGKAVNYTVQEMTKTEGYTVMINDTDKSNIVLTNTHTPTVTSVSGTKTWDDNNNQDGIRPNSITVNLLADGQLIESKAVTQANEWKYQFTNLPKYKDGAVINYTVTEASVPNYTNTITGFNIKNSYTPEKTQVTVTKAWNDGNNQDGIRPSSIFVQLMKDGKAVEGQTLELSEANKWTGSFTDLDKKENGKAVNYTVQEMTKTEGYTVMINDTDKSNIVLTNTHTPTVTSVSGTKTWDDNNNQDGIRPNSITVNLLADGQLIESKAVTQANEWKYQFTNLPKYKDGAVINYTVTEASVPNYTNTITGFNIKNSYTPEKTQVTVTKAWNDGNNQDGIRPSSIFVQLMKDGKAVEGQTLELSEANKWTGSFTDLDKKENGKAVNYTVQEMTKTEGYTVMINDTDKSNIVLTNTHTPTVTSVSGTKTWDDNNNQDGIRPNSITVNLLADGQLIESKAVTQANEWKYQFTNLPKYKDGAVINYTVTEASVPNYTNTITGFNIKNSYTPEKTQVTVTKAWNDGNNQDGIRPSSIFVQLMKDGKAVEGQTLELSEANKWTGSFTDLDKKENGKAVNYTVQEMTKTEGYTVMINDTDKSNIVLTNTHTPTVTSVSGTKTWDDNNNQDGIRPNSITVNLLADGQLIESKAVTQANEWKYQFTNLPKYKDGAVINYTVTEASVPNYTNTITGFNIKNSYTPEKTQVTVTKAWNDGNNQDGIRPSSIFVQLMKDGKAVEGQTLELSEANKWTGSFTDLDKKENGKAVNYTVQEMTKTEGYTVMINDTDKSNIVLTNTHTPTVTSVSGTKIQNNTNFRKTHKILPNTGDNNSGILMFLGGAVISLLAYFIYRKIYRQR